MSLKKNYLEMETYLKTNNKHTIVKKKKIKNAGSKRKMVKEKLIKCKTSDPLSLKIIKLYAQYSFYANLKKHVSIL